MNRLFNLSSFFFTLLRKLLFLWVRTEVVNNSKEELNLDPDKPVCYVLQHSSLSARLVLEQECLKAGLPSSQAPLCLPGETLRRSFFFLYRRQGHWFRRRQSPILTPRLRQLASQIQLQPELDVQIVPVSLFWGRSPDKEKSLLKLLLSDNWAVSGRLQKFLIILIHGRKTFVQFNQPISIRQLVDARPADEERTTRMLARILRVHFRRVRQTVLGPDLSHRRTLVHTIVQSPNVKQVIESTASKEQIPYPKAQAKAYKYADEIASNLTITSIRFLEIILSRVWNKIYSGITLRNIETVREVSKDHTVIYTPCHRSHIDYLLLSYALFINGIMVPHIAAGINLNMPVVGAILRRSGAFFMRRSFKNNALYATVFNEYMHQVFSRGYSVEYFVEGGRSRTGRILAPRAGMISMTLRSFLREHQRPIAFQPVYVGYEKVLEGRTYLGELRGQKKESESIFGLFKSLKNLRRSFGKVNVTFGDPIFIDKVLDEMQPGWRDVKYDTDPRPDWLNSVVDALALKIATNINSAAAINPVNMIASVLLSTSRQAMDERVMATQLDAFAALLRASPYSDEVSLPEGNGQEWISYCESMGLVVRQQQKLGDIIMLEGVNAIQMTYYRNNILHLFAVPALIASLFQNNSQLQREHIHFLVSSIYPYIKAELFIRWEIEEIEGIIDHWLRVLTEHKLLLLDNDSYHCPPIGSANFVMLGVLARFVIQTLERYYISIEVLRKHGPGKITAAELEEQSVQMAQRMSILFGLNAPEFFDKSLFHGFIRNLKKNGFVTVNHEGLLDYAEGVDRVAEDAKLVLNAELRQGILQVTSLN